MLEGKGDDDVIRFRQIRTLDGRLEPVDLIRRNGHPVPRLVRSVFDSSGPGGERSDLLPLYREIMYGLSRLERRTWLPLLLDRSIDEVAESEGVSRAAIYARIRGNSKKQGGMIRKNDYVAIWWRTQRNLHLRKKHV